jgi:hypothetical protein
MGLAKGIQREGTVIVKWNNVVEKKNKRKEGRKEGKKEQQQLPVL